MTSTGRVLIPTPVLGIAVAIAMVTVGSNVRVSVARTADGVIRGGASPAWGLSVTRVSSGGSTAPAGAARAPALRADSTFTAFVDSLRVALKLPGLGIVVVHGAGEPTITLSGIRRVGQGALLSPRDLMHLGSNGKAITASMIASLVEQGLMSWETTLSAAFPEWASTMMPAYRAVTVRQLLAHTAGMPSNTDTDEWAWLYDLKGTPVQQRRVFAERLLREKPALAPGTRHAYSNAGVAIAGVMAERVTGRSWEDLVSELVMSPLGAHPWFGNPGLASATQPWGHERGVFGRVRAVAPDDRDHRVPDALAPAGNISLTLVDYGKFLRMHLRGLEGHDDVLKASTIRELHAPVAPRDSLVGWGLGWGISVRDGVETHGHTGSAGAFIAVAAIQPSRDLAIALLTNIGGDDSTEKAFQQLRALVTARLVGRRPGR